MFIGEDSVNTVPWYVVFILVLILVFALCTIIAGAFTAYFGAGKSRKIGVGLIILGLIVGILFILPQIRDPLGLVNSDGWLDMTGLIIEAIIYILATIVGLLIALGLFLVAIMKS
jgi:hypothetical protein